MANETWTVLAAAAHPDDIEFMMAGTLLRLRAAGHEIHMWNLANGSCGTARHSREEIVRIREAEAEASAQRAGAEHHPPLFDDLGVFYDAPSLARTASVLRRIAPDIILTHAPREYMEDHQNVCRLIVSAAFARGMPNFRCDPPEAALDKPVALYHALPHGLRDGLGAFVEPHLVVDIAPVIAAKRSMLERHRSQREWLDRSQGMGSYVEAMDRMAATVGRRYGGGMAFAEGWLRHSALGFSPREWNPLSSLAAPEASPRPISRPSSAPLDTGRRPVAKSSEQTTSDTR